MKWTMNKRAFAFTLAVVSIASANAQEVNVLTAWYGQSCGTAHGNVTSHVKAYCDRKQACQYGVEANVLGDSAPGCRKNFVVLYACSGQTAVRLAQLAAEASGNSLSLSCATPEQQRK
jgi:hypothetical protein